MQIIKDGVLYDTNNSELIYTDTETKRRYYKSFNGHYFVVFYSGAFELCTEDFIKDLLGKNDVNMWMALFGEPEEG